MHRAGEKRDRSIALFLLGLLLFSPFILSIFSGTDFIFNLPPLFLYIFVVWAGLIAAIAWSAWHDREPPDGGNAIPFEKSRTEKGQAGRYSRLSGQEDLAPMAPPPGHEGSVPMAGDERDGA